MKYLLLILLLFYGQQLHNQAYANTKPDTRVQKLQTFLKNTPLAGEEENFINDSYDFGLDYKLVVAIAGVESGFGKNDFGTHNPFGLMSKGHLIKFNSYRESIWAVTKTIYSYGVDGQITKFSHIYCGCEEKEYIRKINYFYERI